MTHKSYHYADIVKPQNVMFCGFLLFIAEDIVSINSPDGSPHVSKELSKNQFFNNKIVILHHALYIRQIGGFEPAVFPACQIRGELLLIK